LRVCCGAARADADRHGHVDLAQAVGIDARFFFQQRMREVLGVLVDQLAPNARAAAAAISS
jgi:hypothetical protein